MPEHLGLTLVYVNRTPQGPCVGEKTANQERLSEEARCGTIQPLRRHGEYSLDMTQNGLCGSPLAIHKSSERGSEIRGDLLLDPQALRWIISG